MLNEIIKPLNNMLIFKGNIVEAVRIYQQVPADAMEKLGPGASQQPPQPPAATPQPPDGAPLPSVREKVRKRHTEDEE